MKTNKKGISLIVLIITILVMIILAGAVLLYLDDDRVVDKAKMAVTVNNVSVAKEVMTVAKAEWSANKDKLIEDKYYSFELYAEAKLKDAGFEIGSNGGQLDVSSSGLLYIYVEPVIPQGFIASDISTEDDVSEGLVIYKGDETVSTDEDAAETRDQYVWVPVPNISEFVRKDWGRNSLAEGSFDELLSYNLDSVEEKSEYTAMKESVAKYGGFYIARYEAGKENGTLVSKKGIEVWNRISWDDSKTKCKTLSSDTVVSHLIYGEEWDATLNFIAKTDDRYPTNSSGSGNFTKELLKTGSSEGYAKNNIFDMAGNVWEWTMESYSSNVRVRRGGLYTYTGGKRQAAYRVGPGASADASYDGFRSALYLK